ncbi:MAG: hypothetical protein UT05_C0020G0003 [Parcubacteria group bacterium GW2011_GWF2_38_76]|nr:MAG: hypothetical protein UT05_C0020G0003 [Parcubacteria group bacterium GW2011_GWF2_38_76]HBM46047.1 hypothetical protein [Patescibacteria group bacterium]
MKKIFYFVLVIFCLLPTSSFAQLMNPEKINSEIKIDSGGNISSQNIKIIQFAGNTIYGRLFWEESSIKITIKTEKASSVTKKYGEPITVAEMKVGDRLNVEGFLENGTDTLTIIAKTIKNLSNEKQSGKFSGTIIGSAPNNSGLLLKTDSGETITLGNNSSIVVEKGTRRLGYYDIKIGDRVLEVEGVLNRANNAMDTKKVKIYIDLSVFNPRNYQGKLKSLSGTELPTTATITVEGKDYTVKLGANTVVMNNKRYNTRLSRFVVGDTVRFYGAIPEGDDMTYVIGEVIRNVDL